MLKRFARTKKNMGCVGCVYGVELQPRHLVDSQGRGVMNDEGGEHRHTCIVAKGFQKL